jgi:hypothetical protein
MENSICVQHVIYTTVAMTLDDNLFITKRRYQI